MRGIIIALCLLGCEKTTEQSSDFKSLSGWNISNIVCAWDDAHSMCVCGKAIVGPSNAAWTSETQFAAPNHACGKEDTCIR